MRQGWDQNVTKKIIHVSKKESNWKEILGDVESDAPEHFNCRIL